MTYLYPYHAYPPHADWSARQTSPTMQVYVPVTVPLTFDRGDALLLPTTEEPTSGQCRRHSSDRRSIERHSSDRERRHRARDREVCEYGVLHDREPHEQCEHRNEQKCLSERSLRQNETRQKAPQYMHHRCRTDPPSEINSIIAQSGSHLGSRHTRHGSVRSPRSPRTELEAPSPRSPRPNEVSPNRAAARARDDAETHNRARLTLRWVRGLVPGLVPPGATPPRSPAMAPPPPLPQSPDSPPPGYFNPQPNDHAFDNPFVEPVRPGYRRQDSLGEYVRKLAPSIPNFGWRTPPPSSTPLTPAYQAPPVLDVEARSPLVPPPPKPLATPAYPPTPPRPRRELSTGRLLDSVTAAFRPRKVRFADGGQPGWSGVHSG